MAAPAWPHHHEFGTMLFDPAAESRMTRLMVDLMKQSAGDV